MARTDFTNDDQAGAEIFDETHIDDEGEGDLLLDEAGGVPDLTHEAVDDADDGIDEDDRDGYDPEGAPEDDLEPASGHSPGGAAPALGTDEIELVYSGLLDDVRGAQASAAHWEARRLSDDDIESLGYGPDDAADPKTTTAQPKASS